MIQSKTKFFKLRKENKAIKDKIISDMRNLFKLENENYYKIVTVDNMLVTIKQNMKAIVIEIKIYQLKNILIKLIHI